MHVYTESGKWCVNLLSNFLAVVGYDTETGEPNFKLVHYEENSSTDNLEQLNKIWTAIESLAGVPNAVQRI